MLVDLALVAAGLTALTLGGEFALRGAVGLALKLGVSTAMIGLTVVGFGTSAPELMVTVKAALANKPDIALGNVVGSNIANILLIVGVGGAITVLTCQFSVVRRDATAVLAATIGLIALAWGGIIVQWQGAVMVAMLLLYMTYAYRMDRRERAVNSTAVSANTISGDQDLNVQCDEETLEEAEDAPSAWPMILFYITVGLCGLIGGAHLLVDGAVSIARGFGVPESIIGLTLIAIGTSLPELAATIAAALRKHVELAIGNVLGSCLFNILLIIGVTSMVNPLQIAEDIMQIDIWVMLAATIALFIMLYLGARITRIKASLLLIGYCAYMGVIADRLDIL